VIRFPARDRARAIQLLGEDQSRQLVRQRPRREREAFLRLLAGRGAQTIRAADQNADVARLLLEALHPGGEPLRRHRAPGQVACDDVGSAGNGVEQTLALPLTHEVRVGGASRLFADLSNLERPVPARSRLILADCSRKLCIPWLPDDRHDKVHSTRDGEAAFATPRDTPSVAPQLTPRFTPLSTPLFTHRSRANGAPSPPG
jgi:hypothetical protein